MFKSIIIVLATLAACVMASPAPMKRNSVHCGTTGDATLSDCKVLLEDPAVWNAALTFNNLCKFTNPSLLLTAYPAYNLACHGNCCIYATTRFDAMSQNLYFIDDNSEVLRNQALSLMGCGSEKSNSINVLGNFGGQSLCISNGKGCGDCFDDWDLSFV